MNSGKRKGFCVFLAGNAGHASTVWALAFEPTGAHRMASVGDDCAVRFWGPSRSGTNRAGGADSSKTGGGGASASKQAQAESPLTWKCESTLSGYHARPIYSIDWGQAGLLATGAFFPSFFLSSDSFSFSPEPIIHLLCRND